MKCYVCKSRLQAKMLVGTNKVEFTQFEDDIFTLKNDLITIVSSDEIDNYEPVDVDDYFDKMLNRKDC